MLQPPAGPRAVAPSISAAETIDYKSGWAGQRRQRIGWCWSILGGRPAWGSWPARAGPATRGPVRRARSWPGSAARLRCASSTATASSRATARACTSRNWSPRCASRATRCWWSGPASTSRRVRRRKPTGPWIRARLPARLGELAELAYNMPAYGRLRARRRRVPAGADLRALQSVLPRRHLAGAPATALRSSWRSTRRLADERSRFGGLGLRRLARALERSTWRSAARVLAVTGVLKAMPSPRPACRRDRIEVVPNGIDPAAFAACRRGEASAGPVVLGFVGFVRDWHGLDAVIDAMAARP